MSVAMNKERCSSTFTCLRKTETNFIWKATLLPLVARYCFKIGIFYEFQLKHEKSLKFFDQAYRHVQSYYQFLVNGLPPDVVNAQERDVSDASGAESDYEVGIEVSLADASDEEEEGKDTPPIPPAAELRRVLSSGEAPEDMTHQCRAVADWLNFKLLQAGFMSTAFGETEGLLAASYQWRKHAQVMLRNEDRSNPSWNYWSYVAHQRLVMSQLVERHPPAQGVAEEVLLRCSPWRNYMAAAEAELRLDAEIRKELSSSDSSGTDKLAGRRAESMRQKFVGGLDSDKLAPKLREESQKNHAGTLSRGSSLSFPLSRALKLSLCIFGLQKCIEVDSSIHRSFRTRSGVECKEG